MTLLTITKEPPKTMWPTEILQGNLLWRATLATTSSVAYFFFLQKTGYYPLKTSQRMWQHIAATAFLQYSFYALSIDKRLSSLLGAEVDTAVAFVKEKNPTPIELTPTQKAIAFVLGNERFTTFLREEKSEERKTQILCERHFLQKQIMGKTFTIEDATSSITEEVARYALFGVATIASTLAFQNTYPHLSTAGRALRYVVSNIWLDLAIDASGGESSTQSPAQIIDLSDLENCSSLSSSEKRRRVAFYAKKIESLNPPITLTPEMNTLITHARELDQTSNRLPQVLTQDIYSRLKSAKTPVDLASIPEKIGTLATLLPDKAHALKQLVKNTEIRDLFARKDRIATNLQTVLNTPSSLPWYTNPFKKTPTPSAAIRLSNADINDDLDTLRANLTQKRRQFAKEKKDFIKAYAPSTKAFGESETIEGLTQELEKLQTQIPIAFLYACIDKPQYDLIKKLQPHFPKHLSKYITDKGSAKEAEMVEKIKRDEVEIKETLQSYLPENLIERINAILENETISNEELQELRLVSAHLINYYPDVPTLKSLVPQEVPSEDPERGAVIAEIKAKNDNLEFPVYRSENYKTLENQIKYNETRIAEKKAQNSPFKLAKILSAALSVLSILNQTSYLDFFKMTIPLKEVSFLSKENIGDITIRTIFNYCVKKL